jgi:parvulin-like peptidyl-prolyl isomerase
MKGKRIAAILLSLSLSAYNAYADDDTVLATYSGGKVTESQVMSHFKQILDSQPANKDKKFADLDSALQEVLVRGYINSKLLTKEAEDKKIGESKTFQEKLNMAKTQMMQQELMEAKIKDSVTDAAIEQEYKRFVESIKGQDEIKVAHMLVDTKEKALEIKKKLAKGTKFASLVKEYSKDEGSKNNGGDIGYVMKGQLVPEFESAAFAMKVGEVSEPVKTQFGWHVIKVVDKRPVKVPALEDEKANIQARLARSEVEKYITDLVSKADLKLSIPQKQESKSQENKKSDK